MKEQLEYSNVCSSVQDHIIKFRFQSKVLIVIHKALNAKENILVLKDSYEDF